MLITHITHVWLAKRRVARHHDEQNYPSGENIGDWTTILLLGENFWCGII
jgi:hypothetical protein